MSAAGGEGKQRRPTHLKESERVMDVSIVIPIYNEHENISLLYQALVDALSGWDKRYEIVFVDDGSVDGSYECLRMLAGTDWRVKVIRFRRNFGQTAAMQAGIDHACGDVVVTMDGDLQNDPRDIPMMLTKIDAGYDLVHGWRKNRQDRWLNRRLPSMIANWLISRSTRFPIHDLGCTLKAIRREVASELELYGEMHRFIPILAHARGARCVEVVTRHHPRRHGVTKYGISRTFRVLSDLLTVKYILHYFASPMRLFGALGIGCTILAGGSLMLTLGMKWWANVDMTGNPLLLLCVLSMLSSLHFFSLGLFGEVSARVYYAADGKKPYAIRERLNMNSPSVEEPRRVA